jgi:small subunit ribosomal protein S20
LPNIKSAEKRVDIAERNRLRNVAIKSSVKTAVKKVYESIKENVAAEQIQETVNKAYSLIDKAVSKGVIHKNTAARKKSRLVGHVNKNDVPA